MTFHTTTFSGASGWGHGLGGPALLLVATAELVNVRMTDAGPGLALHASMTPLAALLVVEERLQEQEAEGVAMPESMEWDQLALQVLIAAETGQIPRFREATR